jgi:hypothetical protein
MPLDCSTRKKQSALSPLCRTGIKWLAKVASGRRGLYIESELFGGLSDPASWLIRLIVGDQEAQWSTQSSVTKKGRLWLRTMEMLSVD